jgi:hypothetical protein
MKNEVLRETENHLNAIRIERILEAIVIPVFDLDRAKGAL